MFSFFRRTLLLLTGGGGVAPPPIPQNIVEFTTSITRIVERVEELMPLPDVRRDDIGTIFRVTVVDEQGDIVSLVTAIELEITFRSPPAAGSVSIVRTAVLTTDGLDGQMEYQTVPDDAGSIVHVNGQWGYQGRVIFSPELSLRSKQIHFRVEDRY